MTNYVIIGNGVAGVTAAESIRQLDQTGSISMISREDLPFYYRIRLPEYLSGDVNEERLLAKKMSWYEERRITLSTGRSVTGINVQAKTFSTSTSDVLPYDRLLLASGSHSFVPPIPGAHLPGVFTLRTIADARAIRERAPVTKRVVLIGGGLLGLETGQALRKLGMEVTVVEFFPRLLPRQLDNEGAARLKGIMEAQLGFSFRLGVSTKEIIGQEMASGVALEGGEILPCEMVIISAGVRPSLDLAMALGITCDKGIVVNEEMRTSLTDVFAAGDVAQFGPQPPPGIWPAAMEQGRVAGTIMAGGVASYTGTTMTNRLKVVGIDLAAIGEIDADNRYQSRITATDTTYRKIVLDQDNRVIGCILLGDTSDYGNLSRAINDRTRLP